MAKNFWALRMPHPYLPCLTLFNNKGHVCPYLLTGLNKANKEPQNPYLACLALLKDKEPHVSLSPPIIPCLTIRIHVFLIITQDVIEGDKDFKIFSFSPYQHTGKRKSFENFVACPYL